MYLNNVPYVNQYYNSKIDSTSYITKLGDTVFLCLKLTTQYNIPAWSSTIRVSVKPTEKITFSNGWYIDTGGQIYTGSSAVDSGVTIELSTSYKV